MSLEKLIESLVDALNANTEALNNANAKRDKLVAAADKVVGKKTKTSEPVETNDDEDEDEAPKKTKAKADKKEKPAKKAKKVTEKQIREHLGEFLEQEDLDEDEHEDRKAFVKELLTKLGCKKGVSDLDEDHYQLVIDLTSRFVNEDVDVDEELEEAGITVKKARRSRDEDED